MNTLEKQFSVTRRASKAISYQLTSATVPSFTVDLDALFAQ